jgi:hypothetical protein
MIDDSTADRLRACISDTTGCMGWISRSALTVESAAGRCPWR